MKLTPRQFIARLAEGGLKNRVYFFYGPESYLIKAMLKRVITLLGIDASGMRSYDASEVDLEVIISEFNIPLLFSEKKLLVLKNVLDMWKKLKNSEKKELKSSLEKIPSFIFVVLIDNSEIDEGHNLVELIDDLGVVVLCRKARKKELRNWLLKRLSRYGIEDEALINTLLEVSDGSMEFLEKELDKLLASFSKEAVIGEKSYNVFDLIDAIASADSKAFDILDFLLRTRVDPVFISAMMQSFIKRILLIKHGFQQLRSFEKDRYSAILSMEDADVMDMLLKANMVELKIKTGIAEPKKALEEFIVYAIVKMNGLEV